MIGRSLQESWCVLAISLAAFGISVRSQAGEDARAAGVEGIQGRLDFYAFYTRLDYDQPQEPVLLGQLPVNAALGGARHTGDTILYGFTDKSAASLAALARSWNHPAPVENVSGCESRGYDPSQRAYVLTATSLPIALNVSGSKDSPIHNPCFVVENWNRDSRARITIDGEEVRPGKALRQGVVYSPAGRRTLILFLDLQRESATNLIIREARNPNNVKQP